MCVNKEMSFSGGERMYLFLLFPFGIFWLLGVIATAFTASLHWSNANKNNSSIIWVPGNSATAKKADLYIQSYVHNNSLKLLLEDMSTE